MLPSIAKKLDRLALETLIPKAQIVHALLHTATANSVRQCVAVWAEHKTGNTGDTNG